MGCCFSKNQEMEANKGRKRVKKSSDSGPIDENPAPKKKSRRVPKKVVKLESSDDEVVILDKPIPAKSEPILDVAKINIFPNRNLPSASKPRASNSRYSKDLELVEFTQILQYLRPWTEDQYIADKCLIHHKVAERVRVFFDEQQTIPFLARYRQDATGGLDACKLTEIKEVYTSYKDVRQKADSIAITLHKEKKLDEATLYALSNATTKTEIDHLYAAFKPGSKTSHAEKARQLGLEESALKILFNQAGQMEFNPQNYVNKQLKDLDSPDKVLLGWQRIMADVVSKDPKILELVKLLTSNRLIEIHSCKSASAKKEDAKAEEEGTSTNNFKFENYFDFKCSVANIESHQVLALNRAEKQKILTVKVFIPPSIRAMILEKFRELFPHNYTNHVMKKLFNDTFEDAANRLVEPLLSRQVRSELTKTSQNQSVKIFRNNLKQLVLQPPFRGHSILGVDPGFSHGCKLAVVSPTGDVLHTTAVYLHGNKAARFSNQDQVLKDLLFRYKVETIALGNGTACRETEKYLSNLINAGVFLPLKVRYCIVDESGVSIYSVSKEAEVDLPGLDPLVRSAAAIARRVQDPLVEYVKVDPKHIGVGQYQHDMPATMMKTALEEVLVECVSFVGVDLNIASEVVLRKVSGITPSRAKSIIEWREENGFFKNRQQLLKVKGVGPKAFEQCAGFVKILPQTAKMADKKVKKSAGVNGKEEFNPLDMTIIHPESYEAAKSFLDIVEISLSEIGSDDTLRRVGEYLNQHSIKSLAEILHIPTCTLQLIADALKQPVTYDLRSEMGEPLFKTGVTLLEELKVGQILTGRVQNNTSFGAFVDVGVGTSGLIHKSKMMKQDLSVGDRVQVEILSVDVAKERLSLKLLPKGLFNTNLNNFPSTATTSNENGNTVKNGFQSTVKNSVKMEFQPSSSSGKAVKMEFQSSSSSGKAVKMEVDRPGNSIKTEVDNLKPFRPNRYDKRQEPRNLNDLYIGQELEGVVRDIKDYGAFVDIGAQRDGLIHRSKMNGMVVKREDQVTVRILEIDHPRVRISLSLERCFSIPKFF